MPGQELQSTEDNSAQVCESPAQSNETEFGSNAENQSSSGESSTADDATWWKTAPKIDLPWPPCGDKQSKHSVAWDKGPGYTYAFPEKKWPSDGKETLFEAPPVQVPTPCPGVVLDLFAKAEWGLSFGGSLGMAIKKDGENAYSVTGKGTVTGKATIGVSGMVGLGLGGGGISIGVAGKLAASLELSLSGSIEIACSYKNGSWSGTLGAPLKFEGAIKVTPSAVLYVRVFSYNKELMEVSIGEWTIATAGAEWKPGVKYDGSGFSNTTSKPTIIGPTWGSPPDAEEK